MSKEVPSSPLTRAGKSANVKGKAARGTVGKKTTAGRITRTAGTAARRASSSGASLKVLQDVLGNVPAATREGFLRAVSAKPNDGLDTALWGPAPNETEVHDAGLKTLRRQYETRRHVIARSLTRREAALLLGTSEQTVTDRLDAHDLVGLKKGREWRLPAWQFHLDTERGFLPGLARVREVYPGGPVSLTQWATSPNTELQDSTPADQLAAGRVEEVVRAAAASTAAAW